jgi:acyl phosphate:glycerol-3-phosphate acyltransferase
MSIVKIVVAILACAASAYLLGSINFAIVVTRLFTKKDIRSMGSGNAGMTNVLRCVGKVPALLVLIGDLSKAIAAVLLGQFLYQYGGGAAIIGGYISGIAVMLGHIFPLFDHFKGGKGVLTAAGMMIVLDIKVFAICILIFIVVLIVTRYVSVSSICAALSLPVATYILHSISANYVIYTTIMSGAIALVIVYMHRTNIKRLLQGTETKISLKKKIQ